MSRSSLLLLQVELMIQQLSTLLLMMMMGSLLPPQPSLLLPPLMLQKHQMLLLVAVCRMKRVQQTAACLQMLQHNQCPCRPAQCVQQQRIPPPTWLCRMLLPTHPDLLPLSLLRLMLVVMLLTSSIAKLQASRTDRWRPLLLLLLPLEEILSSKILRHTKSC